MSTSPPLPSSSPSDLDELIDGLVILYRERQDVQRARIRLELQCKAICRRLIGGFGKETKKAADALFRRMRRGEDVTSFALGHLLDLLKHLEGVEKGLSKSLEFSAKQLPVWREWVEEEVFGVGALALGAIVGEAGNLSRYSNPAKLWKRMGLAVIGEERQRKVAGNPELAIEHGYCSRRRALMHVVGSCGLMRKESSYRALYEERKAYELERGCSKGHAHRRALRYAEKRFLRDLLRKWRQVS